MMVDLPQRKDSSLRRAFNLLREVELSHHQGLEEGDLCRRVFYAHNQARKELLDFRELNVATLARTPKAICMAIKLLP